MDEDEGYRSDGRKKKPREEDKRFTIKRVVIRCFKYMKPVWNDETCSDFQLNQKERNIMEKMKAEGKLPFLFATSTCRDCEYSRKKNIVSIEGK